MVADYADYYNNDEYQWSLAKLSPNEYYRYATTGVYPLTISPPAVDTEAESATLGGSAPNPPEFNALVSKEGDIPPALAEQRANSDGMKKDDS